ncbi:uncharacterized protein EDB91DRAFT_1080852 [Suillus paluster]|uniref:uncharacterized protein n=1 Tax=Suillus paluster TaxID=48578 RepID=UPI001B8821E4|nr:uncharacterized protein EDB91DRAFT_1080852 [Suillus paluster]KAG1744034.1 hypothetical protein EDB91DRAFT_1080852 [Suillus paluster]
MSLLQCRNFLTFFVTCCQILMLIIICNKNSDQTDSLCSPCLDDSDFALLDQAYQLANPDHLDLLKHRIFGHSTQIESQADWATDLTGSITEPESDEDIVPTAITLKAPPSTGSITEPESDKEAVSCTTVPKPESDWSIMEPADNITQSAQTCLDHYCMFATPSPPAPDSVYWKYFTKEEDARWNDRAGTDESFRAV